MVPILRGSIKDQGNKKTQGKKRQSRPVQMYMVELPVVLVFVLYIAKTVCSLVSLVNRFSNAHECARVSFCFSVKKLL